MTDDADDDDADDFGDDYLFAVQHWNLSLAESRPYLSTLFFGNKCIYFIISLLPYHVRSVFPMLCPLFMFYRSRFCVHFSRPLARRCVIRSPYIYIYIFLLASSSYLPRIFAIV